MRAVRAALLIVVIAVTTGCSAFMTSRVPYPDADIEAACTKSDASKSGTSTSDASKGPRKVRDALGCAAAVRNDMDNRAGLQSKIPRVIGAILIPLTASIAGLAITGTTGAPITALTLGGTALMGEGFWLSSPARRQAYGVGASAVQCVITTLRPFTYLDDDRQFEAFGTNAASLDTKIGEVNRRIADVKTALANASSTPADEAAVIQGEIAAAQGAVAAATLVQSRATEAIARRHGAPREIDTSVDQIIGVVNSEIDKSEPTMEMVRQAVNQQIEVQSSALKGLEALVAATKAKNDAAAATRQATADQRATARNAKRARAAREAELDDALERAREKLSEATDGLMAVTREVTRVLDVVGAPPPASGCVSTAQGAVAAAPFEIVPRTAEVTAGGQVTVLVAGGVGDVQIGPDAAAQSRLDIETTTIGGVRRVVVTVKSGTPAGAYVINVRDTRNRDVIVITVKS
jgi:hypothetical protein